MMLFGKKRRTIEVDGQTIALQPKPRSFTSLFPKMARPAGRGPAQQALTPARAAAKEAGRRAARPSVFKHYIEKLAQKHKGLEVTLAEQGMKSTVYQFVKRMAIASVMLAVVVGIALVVVFSDIGLPATTSVLLGAGPPSPSSTSHCRTSSASRCTGARRRRS